MIPLTHKPTMVVLFITLNDPFTRYAFTWHGVFIFFFFFFKIFKRWCWALEPLPPVPLTRESSRLGLCGREREREATIGTRTMQEVISSSGGICDIGFEAM